MQRVRRIGVLRKADFDESKHPRNKGEFAPKGTGDGGATDAGTAPATATGAQDKQKRKPVHHTKTGDTETFTIPVNPTLPKPTELIAPPSRSKVTPEVEKQQALSSAIRASAFKGDPMYIYANPAGALRVSREKPESGKYTSVNATYYEKYGYFVEVENYEEHDDEEPKEVDPWNVPGHERISKILGPRLTITEIDSPFVQEHLRNLAMLPDHLLIKLREGGGEFFAGEGGVPDLDSMDYLDRVIPRGWPPTLSWNDADGAYDKDHKRVLMGKAHPDVAMGTKSLALHEAGHMIGDILGYDDAPELIAFHKQLYPHLPPYLQQEGPGGKAGRQEFFAEGIVRRAMGAEAKSPEFKPFFDWIDSILAAPVTKLAKADWEEDKHPRAEDGKFGSKTGAAASGGDGGKEPEPKKKNISVRQTAKNTRERLIRYHKSSTEDLATDTKEFEKAQQNVETINKNLWSMMFEGDVEWTDELEQKSKVMEAELSGAMKVVADKKELLEGKKEKANKKKREMIKSKNPLNMFVISDSATDVKQKVQSGIYAFMDLVDDMPLTKKYVEVKDLKFSGKTRPFYSENSINVVAAYQRDPVIVHELGHWLEDNSPAAYKACSDFLNKRTAGEDARPLNQIMHSFMGYDDSEMAKPDKFHSPYVGKIYPNGHTEVLSMGLERMHVDSVEFAYNDSEYFDLIFNIMRGNIK
jgi:hypothetical protein